MASTKHRFRYGKNKSKRIKKFLNRAEAHFQRHKVHLEEDTYDAIKAGTF